MHKNKFDRLDLNLLRTFIVLYQERNMRKASARLFVSQPAISQALQKLRHHFDDELFVKVPSGLESTAVGDQLARDITPVLSQLATVINRDEQFEPATLEQTLKIAVAPIVLTCLSGALFHALSAQAPYCIIELVGWSKETMKEIETGEVLLGINLDMDTVSSVRMVPLVELNGKVIVRRDHPIQEKVVTPDIMAPYPIASVITPGWNDHFVVAANIIRDHGLTPTVGFRSEFVMAVTDVLYHTDFFMPHSDLFPIQHFPQLKMLDVLLDGKPYLHHIYAYYHHKHQRSPLLHWLSDLIQGVLTQQLETTVKYPRDK